jgi:threonine synthase
MDILISSNLERLLSFICGTEKTRAYMTALAKDGVYKIDSEDLEKINETFCGLWANEAETAETIKNVYDTYGYLIDTHTAVAVKAAMEYSDNANDGRITVAVSTASPYKFAADVYASLGGEKPENDLDALDLLSGKTGVAIPYPLDGIASREVRFTYSTEPSNMPEEVLAYIDSFAK